jgi:hypothetical protein
MYQDTSIFVHGKNVDFEVKFVSREEGGYGPLFRVCVKDGPQVTNRVDFFLEKELLPLLLEALGSATEKLRTYLYHNSAARAYIWEEWKTAYDE